MLDGASSVGTRSNDSERHQREGIRDLVGGHHRSEEGVAVRWWWPNEDRLWITCEEGDGRGREQLLEGDILWRLRLCG